MTTESQLKNNANKQISLKELIFKLQEWYRYLLSKWFIIVGFVLLGGGLGFANAYIKKPIYTATTTFVLEGGESGGGLSQYAGLASMAGIDLAGGGGGIFRGDNLLELYKSRTMIEKTLLSPSESDSGMLIIDQYIAINKLREAWDKNPKLKGLQFLNSSLYHTQVKTELKGTRLRDSILGIVVADINKNYLNVAKLDKKLSIIKVDVKAKDEVFAKAFNDELVKNVNAFYKQTKTKKSLDNIAILQHKTDSVRKVMNGAIYSAAAVADATPNLNPTRLAQRIAPVQSSQFSAETNKVILGALVQNLEMSKMALLNETPLIQVVDKPIFPLEKEKVGKAKTMMLGGLLFGFLGIFYLVIRSTLKRIMSEKE
jgi:hypothetical protein